MGNSFKKIKSLLNRKQKESLIILSLLLVIGMFFEVFGLGLILPFITIILDPNIITSSEYSSLIRDFFGEITYKNFLFISLITIILVYLFKTLFLIFLVFKQNSFLSILHAELSVKLFNNYLKKNYSFHLKRNSASLIKNLQVEVNLFRSYCTSLISLIIESSLLFSIICTLIFIEPFGAIIVGLFFTFFSWLVVKLSNKSLNYWGKKRERLDDKISKNIVEGFGGIKEIILLGRTNFFSKVFSKNNFSKGIILRNYLTVSQSPRYLLEIIAVFGVVGFIFIMIEQGKEVNELLTIIGVFVAAVFRMIPSFNKIISCLNNMKYYSNSIDLLYEEFKNKDSYNRLDKSNAQIKLKSEINIENLEFRYKNDCKQILNKINLKISKGDFIGIFGESGSGKSTLIDVLMGLFNPTSGSIKVDGVNINKNLRSWQNIIGYVPQNIFLINDSVKKNIAFGIENHKISSINMLKATKESQLLKFIDSLNQGIDSKVGERGAQISGGQLQRIGIARAIYKNPDLLIFDESTASLDSNTEEEVLKSINSLRGNKTIIMISHNLKNLKDCDYVYSLKNGVLKNEKELVKNF